VVPRLGRSPGSTVNSPLPSETQRQASAAPALREITTTSSAAMKGGIESHAELADESAVLALVAGELAQELGGAGAGDGAEIVDQLRLIHADAVVGDGEGARLASGVSVTR